MIKIAGLIVVLATLWPSVILVSPQDQISYEEPVRMEILRAEQALERGSLAYWIINCESEWDPKICNREFGCRAGMGLFGFISGTWNDTLVRMSIKDAWLPERCWQFVYLPVSESRTEVVFDADCNLLIGLWLLNEDGDVHWRNYSGHCYLK